MIRKTFQPLLGGLLSFALAGQTFLPSVAQAQEETVISDQSSVISNGAKLFDYYPPTDLARVTDSYLSVNGSTVAPEHGSTPLVLLIQDLHCHPGVQRKISGLLDHYAALGAAQDFVAVEGASGSVNTSPMALFPDEEIRNQVTDEFVDRGLFSGMEEHAIKNKKTAYLWGADDSKAYAVHKEFFRRSLENRSKLALLIQNLEARLESLEPKILNRSQKALKEKTRDYESGRLSLARYLLVLEKLSKDEFPQELRDMQEILKAEHKLKNSNLEQDTKEFLSLLYPKLAKEETERLARYAKAHTAVYYLYLYDLAQSHQALAAASRDLRDYLVFNHNRENQNLARFQNALEDLTYRIQMAQAKSQAQKNLIQSQRDLALVSDLIQCRLTEDGLKTVLSQNRELLDRLEALFAASSRVHDTIAFNAKELQDLLSESLDFYALALMRDKPLVEKTLEKQPLGPMVLVTGGFHTSGVARILKEKNISYLTVSPNVDSYTEQDQQRYINLLLGKLPKEYAALTPTRDALSLEPGKFETLARQAAQARLNQRSALPKIARSETAVSPQSARPSRVWNPVTAAFVMVGTLVLVCLGADAVGGAVGQLFAAAPPLTAEAIRKSPEAHEYEDPLQSFKGVDWEHFAYAVKRLAAGPREAALAAFAEIAQGKGDKALIDRINEFHDGKSTYDDPRLDVNVTHQNQNPKPQSLYEGIANSLDALLAGLGQFGKGFKQSAAWLEPTGKDRIDVWTRSEAKAPWYHITLLQAVNGQNYIQIKQEARPPQDLLDSLEEAEPEHGTLTRISPAQALPVEEQTALAQGIVDRFNTADSATLRVKWNDQDWQTVNPTEGKKILFGRDWDNQARGIGKIKARLSASGIAFMDNGHGMDGERSVRMFVPQEGANKPKDLAGTEAQDELAKVRVIGTKRQETDEEQETPRSVSFRRNGRLIRSVPIPKSLHRTAVFDGDMTLDFARLILVDESWENIRIPVELANPEETNFAKAAIHAAKGIMARTDLNDESKLQILNTMLVGLEGLVQSNAGYARVVEAVRNKMAEAARPAVERLKATRVFLPHEQGFARLALPDGKKPFFLHPSLFDWKGANTLVHELKAQVVTGIKLGENQLVAVPFRSESLDPHRRFDLDWQSQPGSQNWPVIKAWGVVALPLEMPGVARLLKLAAKRSGALSDTEQKEFDSLLQLIQILASAQVPTVSAAEPVKEQFVLDSPEEIRAQSGDIDEKPVNDLFKVSPDFVPAAAPAPVPIPQGAKLKHVINDKGEVVEVGTGRKIPFLEDVKSIEPLTHGYYKIEQPVKGMKLQVAIVKFEGLTTKYLASGGVTMSPDNEFAFQESSEGKAHLISLATGESTVLGDMGKNELVSQAQFSRDGKYIAYLKYGPDSRDQTVRQLFFMIRECRTSGSVTYIPLNPAEYGELEFATNPFADVAYLKHKKNGLFLIDLTSAKPVFNRAKHLRTDSSGAYTAIVGFDGTLSLYSHLNKRVLGAKEVGCQNGETIGSIYTIWDSQWRHGCFLKIQGPRGFRTMMVEGQGVDLNATVYREEVTANAVVLGQGWFGALLAQLDHANSDPLQRLEKPGLYKHPNFPLFINKADPDNPVAIDPETGGEYLFRGTIVRYAPKTNAFAGVLQSHHGDGFYGCLSGSGLEKLGVVVMGHPRKDEPPGFIFKGSREYELNNHKKGNPLHTLTINPAQYGNVQWDGKFFVFWNPKTGDVVYLDPDKPEDPTFVPVRPQASAAAVSEPECVPVVLADGRVVDARTGERMWDRVESMEPLAHDCYLIRLKLPTWEAALGRSMQTTVIVKRKGVSFERITSGEKSQIFVSPDKKWVCSLADNTAVELATGEKRYLNNDFKDYSPHPAVNDILKVKISDPQFSRDGKYLTVTSHSSTGEFSSVFIQVVNLQTKTMRAFHSIGDLKQDEVEYAINPFANVVYIKNKDGSLLFYDLENEGGAPKPIHAKHLRTDSTGTYTVVIGSDEKMSIYLHESRKTLSEDDFNGKKINAVMTVKTPRGFEFFVVLEKANEYVRFHGSGMFETLGLPDDKEWYEGIDLFGEQPLVTLKSSTHGNSYQAKRLAQLNPLQTLAGKSLYKHPDFPLFIDHADPNNPKAFDLKMGAKYPYKGVILFYSEQDQTLTYDPDGSWCQINDSGGEFAAHLKAMGKKSSGQPVAIVVDVDYHLWDSDKDELIDVHISDDFNQVAFDGKFFVFWNSVTGGAVLVDPDHPETPIPVFKESISAGAAQDGSGAFLKEKPADAPMKHVIGSAGKNLRYANAGGGLMTRPSWQRLERVGQSTIVAHNQNGTIDVFAEDPAGGMHPLLEDKEYEIEDSRGDLIVLRDTRTGLKNVLNTKRPRPLDHWSHEVSLSRSGRYSVHKVSGGALEGDLAYIDHFAPDPYPILFCRAGQDYQDYRLDDNADAVIVKDFQGKYGLFALKKPPVRDDPWLVKGADHIEIDSSGLIAVVSKQGRLFYVNLLDGRVDGRQRVQVAHDEEHVYVIAGMSDERDRDFGDEINVYHRSDGVLVANSPVLVDIKSAHKFERFTLPRFWEKYTLTDKVIWDRTTNAPAEIRMGNEISPLRYVSNSPTDHKREISELQGHVSLNQREVGGHGFLVDHLAPIMGSFTDKVKLSDVRFMKGGKITYMREKGDDGYFIVIPVLGSIGHQPCQGGYKQSWVNKDQTYILAERGGKFYLIGVDGQMRNITEMIPPGFAPSDVNGKYFVFTSKDTDEIRYLDPDLLDKAASPTQQPELFFDHVLPGSSYRFAVTKAGGKEMIVDTQDNNDVRGVYQSVKRVNADTFLVYGNNGWLSVLKFGADGNPENISNGTYDNTYRATVSHNRFVVIQKVGNTEVNQFLIDAQKGQYFPNCRDAKMTASGRYSVHKLPDSQLVYYDHDEENPVPHPFMAAENYVEHRVHEKADAVITKNPKGTYDLFSLKQGRNLIKSADHIEIDSSGTFAISVEAGKLHYVNLFDTPHFSGGEYLWLSHDEDYIYILTRDVNPRVNADVIWVYKKSDGSYVDREGFTKLISDTRKFKNFTLPRFWEYYDMEKKTILDWETFQPVPFESFKQKVAGTVNGLGVALHYKASPPANPTHALTLSGNVAFFTEHYYNLSKQSRPLVFYLKEKQYTWMALGQNEGRSYQSLTGGKIFYAGGVLNVSGPFFSVITGDLSIPDQVFNKPFQKGFVNQSRTFLLVQRDKTIGLIDADGRYTDLTSLVPTGCVPTDVMGDLFVFSNPTGDKPKFLDPGAVGRSVRKAATVAEAKRGLALWNSVIKKKKPFVEKARGVYNPLVDGAPGEHKAHVRKAVAPKIAELYREEDEEMKRRAQRAFERNEEKLDFAAADPFTLFEERMKRAQALLPAFLARANESPMLKSEKEFFGNLFGGLFAVCANPALSLGKNGYDSISSDLLECLVFGWEVETQEQLEAVPVVAKLIHAIQAIRNGHGNFGEVTKVVTFLSSAPRKVTDVRVPVMAEQISDILSKEEPVRRAYLVECLDAFRDKSPVQLLAYLQDPQGTPNMGAAGDYAYFLTHHAPPVKKLSDEESIKLTPEGTDVPLPSPGVELSQLKLLDLARVRDRDPKKPQDKVMSWEYFLAHLRGLPVPGPEMDERIAFDAKVQRPSGAHTAELAQNSRDEGARELIIRFFLWINPLTKQEEFCEEASDDGPGASQEMALFMDQVSTKEEGAQVALAGFFGTGKLSFFQGVDRVEFVNNNGRRALHAVLAVVKNADGVPQSLRITRMKTLRLGSVPLGLTVRRFRAKTSTIPALEQMLARRAWLAHTALSQNDRFKIFILSPEGKKEQLRAETEELAALEFRVEEEKEKGGMLRILSVKNKPPEDIPTQVINRAGFRVCDISDEFLALVPKAYRTHVQELNMVIQIPLSLIRGREAFKDQARLLSKIQIHIAVAFYQALAYKALTDPGFTFEGLPDNWRNSLEASYATAFGATDADVARLAERINRDRLGEVTPEELARLLPPEDQRDVRDACLKLILLLEVKTPNGRKSLMGERLAILRQIDENRMRLERERLGEIGFDLGSLPSTGDIAHYDHWHEMAEMDRAGQEALKNPADWIVNREYSPEENALCQWVKAALEPYSPQLSVLQVLLVEDQAPFGISFASIDGANVMLVNRLYVELRGKNDPQMGIIDRATFDVNRALARLLETHMQETGANELWKNGVLGVPSPFTEQRVGGTYAPAMKKVSALWLTNHKDHDDPGTMDANPPAGPVPPSSGGFWSRVRRSGDGGGRFLGIILLTLTLGLAWAMVGDVHAAHSGADAALEQALRVNMGSGASVSEELLPASPLLEKVTAENQAGDLWTNRTRELQALQRPA